jgi:hypothetical protein
VEVGKKEVQPAPKNVHKNKGTDKITRVNQQECQKKSQKTEKNRNRSGLV